MIRNSKTALFYAPFLVGAFLATGALAQDGEDRYPCLRYDQVEAIHQMGESHIILEVEGGTTLYLLTLEDRCLSRMGQANISLEASRNDGCVRTTDRVQVGRRECYIEDFALIETQSQLDEVLATRRARIECRWP